MLQNLRDITTEVIFVRERSQRFDPRQTMRSDTFEIFHYKEPRPDVVEVHHHDFYEVYFLVGGKVEYWVEGRILRPQAGDLLLINPMELHRPIVDPESPTYERIVLWINKAYLERLTEDGELSRCFDPSLPNLIRPAAAERTNLTAWLSNLVRETYSRDFCSEYSAFGIFLQLMVNLNRIALHTQPQQEETAVSDLVDPVLHYIGRHINETLTLDSIAERFFVSKYHLSHTFTREVGVSLHRNITMRRLLMARQLLATGMSAGQVSSTCGFSDYTSFYRAFKAEYGISPGAVLAE